MCTAIAANVNGLYFGRNLDFEYDFGERITITPRNYVFSFKNGESLTNHFTIIGMSLVEKDYPLYFDAFNEKGLAMAGLNFPGNAFYNKPIKGKQNIASFELIPYILSKCANVIEAEAVFSEINITDDAFSDKLKPTPLHWIISDNVSSIVLEQTADGVKVHKNEIGVLTNNPEFDYQLFNLNNYMSVSQKEPENLFSNNVELIKYSRGMGAIGLPGDLSSMSRFVRASFFKLNSQWGNKEEEIVSQFFRLLYSVYQIKGGAMVGDKCEMTHYSSCCNTKRGIYYYTTYNNSAINAVNIYKENLDSKELITYELIKDKEISFQN
ncbi:MAG: choloylglycine hydrolase [Clostridia bacterium]|nr:choloylglycine hydrolase [Clostridia bacterium]